MINTIFHKVSKEVIKKYFKKQMKQMNKANKCETALLKAFNPNTGKTDIVYCGMIASDWDGENLTILLCHECQKKAKNEIKKDID